MDKAKEKTRDRSRDRKEDKKDKKKEKTREEATDAATASNSVTASSPTASQQQVALHSPDPPQYSSVDDLDARIQELADKLIERCGESIGDEMKLHSAMMFSIVAFQCLVWLVLNILFNIVPTISLTRSQK